MIKTTYRDLLNFRANAQHIISENEGKFNKFLYALSRSIKLTDKNFEDFDEKRTAIQYEFAAVDENGFIIKNENDSFKFKPDNELILKKKIKELLDQNIEVTTFKYNLPEAPLGVNVQNWDSFVPFVLDELTDKKLEELIAK